MTLKIILAAGIALKTLKVIKTIQNDFLSVFSKA